MSDEQREEIAAIYRRGNFGYGEIKKRLADAADAYWTPARERRASSGCNDPTTCATF
ncbi:MAG: hypothetical protein R3B96_14000 [Pirellulaceae bacterium]